MLVISFSNRECIELSYLRKLGCFAMAQVPNGRDVIELMLSLTKQINCTILLITHDSRILDVAERIIYMEDGNLINTNVSLNESIITLNE